MSFDQPTRARLAKFVAAARGVITEEFTEQFQGLYGISLRGEVASMDRLAHLDDAGLATAARLRERINYLVSTQPDERGGAKAAVARLAREQAFTVLNRMAALRMAEARDLIVESVSKGYQSRGFKVFETVAGSALGDTYCRYRRYLLCLFDELAIDLGVLFDRRSPQGLLFPREPALVALLELLNSPDLARLWAEDETIGWIYQYYNDPEERKKMRDPKQGGSAAPRNSRELAVRNQFFTPRYVVEFLTDNTLGRLWYEMTRGETKLKGQCRYLVRRPNEIHLPAAPDDALPWLREFLLTGDLRHLPEIPPETEVFAFLNCFPDIQAAMRHCRLDHQSVVERYLQPLFDGKTVPQVEWDRAHVIELVDALARYAIGPHHDYPAPSPESVVNLTIVGPLWRELHRLAHHPPDGVSQVEALKQPVFIPHRPIRDPRTIRVLDPACGSMHFGLYAFDLFEVIYDEAWEWAERLKAEGREPDPAFRSFVVWHSSFPAKSDFVREVPRLIIEHNLHGIDIDPRCVQIAGLSLWLRAQKSWQRLGLKPAERPAITRSNIVCAEPMPGGRDLLREFVEREFKAEERGVCLRLLEAIFDKMQLAGEAGSLLQIEEEIRSGIEEARAAWQTARQRSEFFEPAQLAALDKRPGAQPQFVLAETSSPTADLRSLTSEVFWNHIEERMYGALRDFAEQAENGGGFQRRLFAEDAARGFAFIDLCRQRYDVALMNPPFGDASLPSRAYIEDTYGDTKGDVYKAFVECFHARLVPAGYLGIISSRTGFFLGQSEDWRTRVVLRLFRPIALADLGSGVLDAMVEVAAYVLRSLSAPEARDLTHSIVPVLGKVVRDSQDRFSLPKWQAARDGLKRHQAVAELEHLEAHGFIQRSPGDIVRYTPLWSEVRKVTAPPAPVFPLLVCVRALADEDKGATLLTSLHGSRQDSRFACDPADFEAIPGSPFAYWIGQNIRDLFSKFQKYSSGSRDARHGPATSDDFKLLRAWWEVVPADVARERLWVPYAKGGAAVPYYLDQPLLVAWEERRFTFLGFFGRPGRWQVRLESSDCFFKAGFTWPLRAASFTPQILPSGCVFSARGYAAFSDEEPLASLMGLMASSVFDFLFKLLLGRFGFPEFVVGALQQLPIPKLDNRDGARLAELVVRGWSCRRSLDSINSSSHAFLLPGLIELSDRTLAERAAAWSAVVRTSEEAVAAVQAEIDDIAFRLYGLDTADRAALTSTLVTEPTTDAEAGEDEDTEAATADATALAADLLAYALGCAFGRWDIRYATGERPAPPAPDPFAPLTVCPPGMLQNVTGLPAAPGDVPASYPVRITWPGILVDDPAHPEDIERRVREVLTVLCPARADAIADEAYALLGSKSLREWIRKPAGFFADHLKRYSKSRRQAPIYWPLSTPSGSYTVCLYYHRLTDQTLHQVLADFLDPKIRRVQVERDSLAAANKNTGRAAELQEFVDELQAMKAAIEGIIKLPWKPNLNDGVLITASPLWSLFRLPKWQKDLKACWEELQKGDYDWAHLAYTIWPRRVEKDCETDRSLAIAHGLEHLCKVELPKPKTERGRKRKAAANEFELLGED